MAFPKKAVFLFLSFIFLLLAAEPLLAQRRLRFDAKIQGRETIKGERIDYLTGNVRIRQDETLIWADSARIEGRKAAQAFGNVRIKEGDSVNITAKRLYYDGGTGLSQLRENVVYSDGKATLFTDNLDYNKGTGQAAYFGGGRMIDGENTLTSERGIFNEAQNTARFYDNVKVVGPDGTITSDTLFYNTETGKATFRGPTRSVRSDGTVSVSENGLVYNLESESATIMRGNVETQDYIIQGNQLNFDQQRNIFTADQNVRMVAKNDDIIITGENAIYYRDEGITYITGNPVMRRPVEGDTLYLRADTLYSVENKVDSTKMLYAYPKVRIFKSNLQGRADSLVYNAQDTLLTLYQDPVLWSEGSQLTGDTVLMFLKERMIDRMEFRSNGFVVSEDSLEQYNQVKGRNIYAWFVENELNEVLVDGNAESVYHVLNDAGDGLMGLNRGTAGRMRMLFQARKLNEIRMYNNPEGKFVPPHELEEPQRTLSGFEWREEERPTLEQVLGQAPLPEGKPQEKSNQLDRNLSPEGDAPARPKQDMQPNSGKMPVKPQKRLIDN